MFNYHQKLFYPIESIYSARNKSNYNININKNFSSTFDYNQFNLIEKAKTFNIKQEEKKKYISFNKIRLVITQNYGNRKNVGLTGTEF